MPMLKKKLTGNFTIINNTVLRDKRMGCTERGAYVTHSITVPPIVETIPVSDCRALFIIPPLNEVLY